MYHDKMTRKEYADYIREQQENTNLIRGICPSGFGILSTFDGMDPDAIEHGRSWFTDRYGNVIRDKKGENHE